MAGPETLVEAQPFIGGEERRRIQPADVRPALDPAAYKAGRFQHPDVLGGCRKRHTERRRKFTDVPLAGREVVKHRTPGRVGQGVKHGVQR